MGIGPQGYLQRAQGGFRNKSAVATILLEYLVSPN